MVLGSLVGDVVAVPRAFEGFDSAGGVELPRCSWSVEIRTAHVQTCWPCGVEEPDRFGRHKTLLQGSFARMSILILVCFSHPLIQMRRMRSPHWGIRSDIDRRRSNNLK